MNEESVRKHGECLTDEVLADYLEGTLEPVIQAASEGHLAACDSCRRKLAGLMRLLQPETTPEEEAELQSTIETCDLRRLPTLLVKPVAASYPQGKFVALAGIAALILLAVVRPWFTTHRGGSVQTPAEILQMLLTNDRPFEARLAGEPHLELNRGRPATPGANYVVLDEEMTQLSADQYEMGKFYLIQSDFTRAIPNLERAEKDPAAPPAVHNDLGVAYMERAGAENLTDAAREFGHALDRNPNFLPAIFNFSILYDRMGMPAEADKNRARYLQLDSKSGWANEVRLKMGTAQLK